MSFPAGCQTQVALPGKSSHLCGPSAPRRSRILYSSATNPSRSTLLAFLNKETSAGLALMGASALALLVANGAWAGDYARLLDLQLAATVNGAGIDKPLILWINDGLMAVFFFLVGLEVKREVLAGQLNSWRRASLPIVAAVGGMVLPALVFTVFNLGEPVNLRGWAIPAATDIAFALGLLALLGPRVPVTLKALLLAIAIIDDIGAITIIALFYSAGIDAAMLGGGAAVLAAMVLLNHLGVARSSIYIALAAVLWVFVLKSGVHATLAGVAAALTIPLATATERPLERLEHALHPWVAFAILPVFAFANAGVSFEGLTIDSLAAPLPLGIAGGLVIGKLVGVAGFAWVAERTGVASLPDGLGWTHIVGLAALAGVGFTMSLFIGGLAFADAVQVAAVKLGVLMGSAIAALSGLVILALAMRGTVASARPQPTEAASASGTPHPARAP